MSAKAVVENYASLKGAHIRNGKIPMSLNSINTNAQSLIALQSLNSTNEQLSLIQKRVSTGYRVADARDDGGAFAVAQSVRSDMAGVVAVNEQLGGVKGVLETTFAALSVVSDTMKQLRATLTRLADGAISADQRTAYQEQYTFLAAQVASFVDDAGYNGRTLLSINAGGTPVGGNITAIRNETGSLFTIEAVDGGVLKLDPDAFPPKPAPAAFEAAIKANPKAIRPCAKLPTVCRFMRRKSKGATPEPPNTPRAHKDNMAPLGISLHPAAGKAYGKLSAMVKLQN